ncbi:MAG: hypothetical protein ACFFER_17665 [Candidatus Thorarchaeota archaeon]
MDLLLQDKMAIGTTEQSSEIGDKLASLLRSKLGSSDIKGAAIEQAITTSYSIFLQEFKSHIKALFLGGLKTALSARDRSLYFLRHPRGRIALDEILRMSANQMGLALSRKQTDLALELFMTIRGRALTLMIEGAILYSSGNLLKRKCSSRHLWDTLWLSEQVVTMAYLDRTLGKISKIMPNMTLESFRVLENGKVAVVGTNDYQKESMRLNRLYSLENRDIASSICDDTNKDIKSWIESYRRFDGLWLDSRGYRLTDAANILLKMIVNMKDCYRRGIPKYVCQISGGDLLKNVTRNLDLSRGAAKHILKVFTLTSGRLRNTDFPEWHFPRTDTIQFAPILGFSVDSERTYCFSEQVVASTLGMLLAYPLGARDKTHGDSEAESFKRELTRKFEEQVANVLENCGLKTYTNVKTHVGEIDVLAYNLKKKLAVIAECKAPKARLDPASIPWQVETLEKWVKRVERKAEYVKENLNLIHGFAGYENPNVVMPVIVTQRPWAKAYVDRIDIIHILELNSWIRRLSTNSPIS